MIQESTIEAVYPLADLLAGKGISVYPVQDTPVASLQNSVVIPDSHENLDLDPIAELMRGSRAPDLAGEIQHDVVMEEVVKVVSKTVSNNLRVAQSVVNPAVKEAVSDAKDHMAKSQNLDTTKIAVVPVNYGPVWDNPSLAEMISRYDETPMRQTNFYLPVPNDTDPQALRELVMSGASRFDDDLKGLLDNLGDKTLQDIYLAAFSEKPQERMGQLEDLMNVDGDVARRNWFLILHLFARRMYDNPPSGTPVSLQEYNAHLSNLLAQTGRHLNREMRQREKDTRRRNLIRRWPMFSNNLVFNGGIEIYVNGDLYNSWLEKGGSPETLMGSMVSDQAKDFDYLIENKARYEKTWERRLKSMETALRMERFNHAMAAIEYAVTKQINALAEDDLIVEREVLHSRLQERLKTLGGKFYDNLYVTVRDVLCYAMFPHTDALRVLEAIDAVADDYPEMDIREAALLGTIEYVSVWVAKLLQTKKFA